MDIETLQLSTRNNNIFTKRNITTVQEVANLFPTKYYDFTTITKYNDLQVGEFSSVRGIVIGSTLVDNNLFLKVKEVGTTNKISITFFGMKFLYNFFIEGNTYYFGGKISEFHGIQMTNPIVYAHEQNKSKVLKVYPIYSKIPSISNESLNRIVQSAVGVMNTSNGEPYDLDILKEFDLIKQYQAYRQIHAPSSMLDLAKAEKRFIFEDLFELAFQLALKNSLKKNQFFKFNKFSLMENFISGLPFELTTGQKETIDKIKKHSQSDKGINALVQGDVGTGKTIVAFSACILAKENGYQSAILCPTTVLAMQHFEEYKERTKDLGIKVEFLNSDTKVRERNRILKALESGEVDTLIGTHSLLSEKVVFKNLALMVVDEEHRFGVKQREKLLERSKGLHFISMSATPIPRTLALTIYGESIDVYTIKTKPANRKEVKTVIFNHQEKIFDAIYRQFKEGHQSYIVCPMIDDSSDVKSVENVYNKFNDYFKRKGLLDIKASIVTGKMKTADVDAAINKFSNFETHVLISTTVIEVGVNVTNATVMVIEDARQFGLAQLHQLRGRVGRGSKQSYCVLVGDPNNDRLKIMTETTDGFRIAQEDLKLRGSGCFLGTKQSGENRVLMLALSNQELYANIQRKVKEIFKDKKKVNKYNEVLELEIS